MYYTFIAFIDVVFPRANALWENNHPQVDNLMFTSYEGNNCFIIPKLPEVEHVSDVLPENFDSIILFSRRQQNNFCYE